MAQILFSGEFEERNEVKSTDKMLLADGTTDEAFVADTITMAARFNKGEKGDTPTVEAQAESVASDQPASVVTSPTATGVLLDFKIPKGQDGEGGNANVNVTNGSTLVSTKKYVFQPSSNGVTEGIFTEASSASLDLGEWLDLPVYLSSNPSQLIEKDLKARLNKSEKSFDITGYARVYLDSPIAYAGFQINNLNTLFDFASLGLQYSFNLRIPVVAINSGSQYGDLLFHADLSAHIFTNAQAQIFVKSGTSADIGFYINHRVLLR